jgi:hypothetical protein
MVQYDATFASAFTLGS